jgi:hypothetical protein
MWISILTMFALFVKVVEVIVIVAVILLALDLALYAHSEPRVTKQATAVKNKNSVRKMMEQERIRREKFDLAHEGFFEESYVRGFDSTGALIARGVKVPTERALEYYQTMDQLADTVRMDTIEEIQNDFR